MYENLSPQLTFTFNYGVMVAVNAISDAYGIIDGPGCSTYRSYMVHGRHDWNSTMLSCTGYHRLQYAGVSAHSIAGDTEGMMREVVHKTGALEHSGVVIITALPMCTITGPDYKRIAAEIKTPAFEIAERSIDGDWFEGFATTLYALADGMELKGGKKKKTNVALIGHFMDRCEGDQIGNLNEYRRVLSALGLNVVSIWPDGGSYKDLQEVKHAGTIISLPYARKAAKRLAQRLKADLIETLPPFGLEATEEWIRTVAAATGKKKEAEAFIDKELERVAPRLEWVIPYAFLNKKMVYSGDPHLLTGIRGICKDLGMRLSGAYLTGIRPSDIPEGPEAHFQPRITQVREKWERHLADKEADILIGNTDVLSITKPTVPALEFGFPSIWTHSLAEEPFLGFNGFLFFAGRMAKAMTAKKQKEAWSAGALEKDDNPVFKNDFDHKTYAEDALKEHL
jgi:nitrogenase molybdenum-iron protein alpha/beta subunit